MPNTREDLVDLIHRSACVKYGGEFGDEIIQEDIDISDEEIERIADHLIANGVTVQEWISVKDRLPKKDGDYLCYKKYGLYEVFGFAKDGRKINKYDFNRDWKNVWYFYSSEWGYIATDSVTHWMPLPEPPKE